MCETFMKYYLGVACQNTFVVFDYLDYPTIQSHMVETAHLSLIANDRDDALILLNGEWVGNAYYAEMVVVGLDGMLAEFCGNGARSCAAYLFKKYPYCKTFFLKTKRNYHLLKHIEKDIYSVTLPPVSFNPQEKFMTDPMQFKGQYTEMLEPHLVFVGAMSDEQLLSLGRELNQRKDLFPLGINVNAWHFLKEGSIYVKTYERGVQRLTRSCGTGSAACASRIQNQGVMDVFTPGGPLKIILGANGIELIGEGIVYEQ